MTIRFPRDACNRHPSRTRLRLPWIALAALFLLGCSPKHEAARLDARPSGKYGETITWLATAADAGPRHRVEVELELDEAQLMGWAKTNIQYQAYLDVRIEQPGEEPVEQMLLMPITEERRISESKEVIQIAYLVAGEQLPNGFRLVTSEFPAFSFKPVPGEQKLSVHLRTPAGAERKMLRAIRTVRLRIMTGKGGPGVLSTPDWIEQERVITRF